MPCARILPTSLARYRRLMFTITMTARIVHIMGLMVLARLALLAFHFLCLHAQTINITHAGRQNNMPAANACQCSIISILQTYVSCFTTPPSIIVPSFDKIRNIFLCAHCFIKAIHTTNIKPFIPSDSNICIMRIARRTI